MCQRTENRARKMHVFASVCSQVMKGRGGVGWGGDGMLTFLVLLHLLPLQYMLLRCTDVWQCCFAVYMKGWGGVWGEGGKISCHTGTIDATWSAVKDFIPNSLCSKSKDLPLYVKCWQWRYVNLHTHLQQKTISTLKRLL